MVFFAHLLILEDLESPFRSEIIQIVACRFGEELSKEYIEKLPWPQKQKWLERDPVTAARQIDYVFSQLWGKVILSGAHPLGQVLNYGRRKEMQGRGVEHFHAALHTQGAPKVNEDSDEEVVAFIDKHISCQLPASNEDPDLHKLVDKLQRYHHTRTCKKKKGVSCRFHFPKPPSSVTTIARCPDTENAKVLLEQASRTLNKVYTALQTVDSEKPPTQDELLQTAGISSDEYFRAISLSLLQSLSE